MLVGKKTFIRPLDYEDIDLLYQWYSDQDFLYYLSGGWPINSMLKKEEIEKKFFEEDNYRYAILDQNKDMIGTLGFDEVNICSRAAKIYIGIGNKDYFGKSYGTDALAVFIKYLFNQWNFHRITAETWDGNQRAIACYQKLGFQIEGKLRDGYYVHGKYRDVVVLGLLKKDFQQIEDF
ncbi:MAG: GNAT family protein [Eubacteriales bacterium]